MKKTIMQLIKDALSKSEKNLLTIEIELEYMSEEELTQSLWREGKTKDQVLKSFRKESEKYQQCVDWLANN